MRLKDLVRVFFNTAITCCIDLLILLVGTSVVSIPLIILVALGFFIGG